jgi:alpha-ribazole phosphatase
MATTDTVIDLLRHGEPVGGRGYRGSGVDDPLTEAGWRQMRAAVGAYRDWDRIITSPLLRCRDFAEELGARIPLPVTVEPDLREIGFGEWEGHTREQVMTVDPDGYAAFYRDPERFPPPGAEPLARFAQRVIGAYETLLAENGGRKLLVVAHAGVVRALIAYVLSAPPAAAFRIRVDYAGISRIRSAGGRALLEFQNRRALI